MSVLETVPLGMPWTTADPFLFCVHHDDKYPRGNAQLGPASSLAGRRLGMDFEGKDGWRMYHGEVVPGFPQHPHRGFETITIVRRGLVDHSDSLGAAARYGRGDVQWLTAGGGISHSEMFPLVEDAKENPLELFQIWLNLPAKDKLAEPHFTMFWDSDIPRLSLDGVDVTIVAGELEGRKAPAPPPKSWASHAESDVAIFTIRMSAGSKFTLPPSKGEDTVRVLYFFAGKSLRVDDHVAKDHAGLVVDPTEPVTLEAGDDETEVLMLQGRPIGEPVVAHGPFVMNTRAEVEQAFADYRKTRFGGWPWPKDDPVHAKEEGRFARHADGKIERAP
jgi:redox-sensitive bicupin YhaK (pirin superfamily)